MQFRHRGWGRQRYLPPRLRGNIATPTTIALDSSSNLLLISRILVVLLTSPPWPSAISISNYHIWTKENKANLRYLIVATGLGILLKLDSNHWFFRLYGLEMKWMTLKNNRAPLLGYIKLCALFQSHLSIQTGVTVRTPSVQVLRLDSEKNIPHYCQVTTPITLNYEDYMDAYHKHFWLAILIRNQPHGIYLLLLKFVV